MNTINRLVLCSGMLPLLQGAASAESGDPLILEVSQESYDVGEDIRIDISGGPEDGVAVWLLDFAPGPATHPVVGTLDVGLTPSVLVLVLPPIGDGYTFVCGPIDCEFPLLNATLYMQVVAFDGAGTPCLSNPEELRVEDGGNCELTGCTPGYWKNHPDTWTLAGYSPSDDYDTVFGTNVFEPDQTLQQVLDHANETVPLAFHSVAALLNASHPEQTYPFAPSVVIQLTADAFASGDHDVIEDQKDVFDAFNNENCIF